MVTLIVKSSGAIKIFKLLSNTILAAKGSEKILNSAAGVILPNLILPPIMDTNSIYSFKSEYF